MNAAFVKYPGHDGLVSLTFSVVTLNDALCKDKSTINKSEPPPIAYELLQHAFKSFAAIGHDPKVHHKALVVVARLLRQYPDHLRFYCDTDILAHLINVALDVDAHQVRNLAIRAGRDLVDLLKLLDKSQLEELSTRGVYKHLRHLLPYHQDMEAQHYEQLVTGVGIFTAITPCTSNILMENIHTALLDAAKTFSSSPTIQTPIWRILAFHCGENALFTHTMLALGVFNTVSQVLQQNNSETTESVLQFVIACSNSAPESMSHHCLEHKAVMNSLVAMIDGASSCREDDITNVCGLLASICEDTSSPKVVEYKLVSKLEDCARKFPHTCALPALIGIGGMLTQFQKEPGGNLKSQFFSEDHHLFISDMLSNNEVVSNSFLVELVYTTFQNMLRVCPANYLSSVCSLDFVRCFVASFVRDIASFPEISIILVFTAHLFLFQITTKGPIEIFRDLGFHTIVTNLIRGPVPEGLCATTVGLLSCLTTRYHEQLNDLKPLLDCHMLDVVIEKALTFSEKEWESPSGEAVKNTLLKMTVNNDITKELYKRQYLDKFLEMFCSNLQPAAQCCVINCIGNIALCGYEVKKVLVDRMVHHMLLDILRSGDPSIIAASCRLLHILVSVDLFLQEFLEAGCAGVTVDVVKAHRGNPSVCCSALGLLSSMVTKAVRHHYASLEDILEVVTNILKTSTNGRLISYTALIFLILGDLDVGISRLREKEVQRPLMEAMKNIIYKIQGPNLEKWATHLIEELFLYTISVKPPTFPWQRALIQSPKTHACDWPPLLPDTKPADHSLLQAANEGPLFKPHFPVAVELDDAARQQLSQLGINTTKPVFRVGRVYGSTFGTCKNCEMDGMSDELVIRTHGLTPHQYQNLIDNGWYRRGGVKMYRLRQKHRPQCCDWETRVSVKEFDYRSHKSYSKVLRRIPTARLTVESLPTHFSQEAFNLYNEYNFKKHDKTPRLENSYIEHAVDSVISNQTVNGFEYGTYHQLYRLDGRLIAVGIIDIVPKGIVSAYMWYSLEKEVSKYSLGVYSALKEIEFVRKLSEKNPEMQYYYLQGWNDNNKKLAYKANYPPEEFYCACITPEWLPSSEAVKEVKEKYLKEHMQDQNGHPSCNAATPVAVETTDKDKKLSTDVPCSAFEKDRAKYQQLTGQKPDVSKMVVCLNYSTYMHLGEVFSKFGVEQSQRELMERRFEELLVAIGPELGAQLVIDLRGGQLS